MPTWAFWVVYVGLFAIFWGVFHYLGIFRGPRGAVRGAVVTASALTVFGIQRAIAGDVWWALLDLGLAVFVLVMWKWRERRA